MVNRFTDLRTEEKKRP